MKKVLLIYPRTGIDPDRPHPPHSILTIAGVLERKGYSPVIIDARVEKKIEEKIKQNIDGAICVGLSVMTGFQIKHALGIAKYIKELNPNLPLVWGGVHVTFLPQQSCKNKYIDIAVSGEGDITFAKVVESIDKNKNLKKIPGITYKEKGKIKTNLGEELIDLDTAPETPWHLIDVKRYLRSEFGTERVLTILTSRGCPHRCTFCYNTNFNKRRWRSAKINRVIKEIKKLRNSYNINGVYLIDDNFFVNRKRVEEFCKALIKDKIKLGWATSCRVNYFDKYDDNFLKLLKESGCKRLFFGVESGSPRIIDLIHKDIKIEQVLNTAKKCAKFGIIPEFSFMTGFPTENKKDRNMTLILIDKILKVNSSASIGGLFLYTAYPGTPLFDLAIKKGFKTPKSLEGWMDYSFMTAEKRANWITKSEKKKIKVISFIVRIIFNKELIKKSFKNPFYKLVLRIFKMDGELRWKLRIFSVAPEWRLLEWMYNRLSG